MAQETQAEKRERVLAEAHKASERRARDGEAKWWDPNNTRK